MSTIKVQTRIGTLKFKQVNDNRISVACKGRARLRLSKAKDGVSWEAVTVPPTENSIGAETIAVGKDAKRCYQNAVSTFWQ